MASMVRKNTSSKWGTSPVIGYRSKAFLKRSRWVMLHLPVCIDFLAAIVPHDGRVNKGRGRQPHRV